MFFKPKQRLKSPHKFAFKPQKTFVIICVIGGLTTSIRDLGTSSCVSEFPCKSTAVVDSIYIFNDARQFSPTQEELPMFPMLVVTLCFA